MIGGVRRPEVGPVLSQLKGFQRDTAEYAFQRLYLDADSTHRFLVADEVGLGKTLVARGVIAKAIDHLWDKLDRIDVIYICSNAEIARQNINRLRPTGHHAFSLASRITLLPLSMRNLESERLNFISFTPGTSFHLGGGQGVWRERALLYWLLKDAWGLRGTAPLNLLQGGMGTERFRERVREFTRSGDQGGRPFEESIVRRFGEDLDHSIEADRAAGKPDLRARFEQLCDRFGRAKKHIPEEDKSARSEIVGDLRKLLARTCLSALEPDLIILDEFQRFRELLHGEDDAAQLARDLFGYADARAEARVLLLSATPYKMYTLSHESAEDDHYRDFLRTMQFLTAKQAGPDELAELLPRYRAELFALGDGEGSSLGEVKERVERCLRKVMARTERIGAARTNDGMLREVPAHGVRLEAGDVRSFASLQSVATSLGQPDVVEYWKSSPYLLNFMNDYKLKQALVERIDSARIDRDIHDQLAGAQGLLLDWEDAERYRELNPRNARLRGFLETMLANDAWKSLWIPPAAPYYGLEEPFASLARSGFTKRLVFSAWTVVPRVVSTLTSYEVERRIFTREEAAPENTAEARARRRGLLEFSFRDERLTGMPVLALLYPSPTLAELGDPLRNRADSQGKPRLPDVLSEVEARLTPLISDITAGASREGVEDERWYWAAPILLDVNRSGEASRAWLAQPNLAEVWSGVKGDGEESDTRWNDHVEFAAAFVSGTQTLGRPPADLLRVLALLAIAGAGNAVLRSFWRISRGSVALDDLDTRNAAARTAWAFRTLFNQLEAMAILRADHTEVPYWRRVLEYSADGCLTSVIDEWAHLLREFEGLFDAKGAVLVNGLADAIIPIVSLRTANLGVDEIALYDGRIVRTPQRMRTRFAMRFGEERSEGETEVVREDLVRAAFNSPFWPFALVTTSVGQEGLDFHPYCHAVVHWNLPANPVDLEQREGRIHRYKGHAIRKNVATHFADRACASGAADPWEEMFNVAGGQDDGNDRGLSPYWIFPVEDGAYIERHVPALPFSRDRLHLEALRRSLAVYRMVFGQPRQDDLMAYLLEHVDRKTLEAHRELLQIRLSPPQIPAK